MPEQLGVVADHHEPWFAVAFGPQIGESPPHDIDEVPCIGLDRGSCRQRLVRRFAFARRSSRRDTRGSDAAVIFEGVEVAVPGPTRVTLSRRPHPVGDTQVSAECNNIGVANRPGICCGASHVQQRWPVHHEVADACGRVGLFEAGAVPAFGRPDSGRQTTGSKSGVVPADSECEARDFVVEEWLERVGGWAAKEFDRV